MTLAEVLAEVDEIKPNTYDDQIKIRWISELDGKIYNDVILTHEHDADLEAFTGYDNSDLSTELLVGFPYTDIYRNYVFALIDFSNGETDRYQNSMSMFQTTYNEYCNHYNRTHAPVSYPLQLF